MVGGMLKKVKLLILLLNVLFQVSGQNLDSLQQVFKTTEIDSIKIDAANYIGYALLLQGDTTLIYYLNQADSIAQAIDYKKGQGDAHFVFGLYYYYYPTDYIKALKHYKKALKIRKEIKDEDAQARCNVNMGNVYWRMENFEGALQCYIDAMGYYKKIKDARSIADAYNNIGLIYLDQRILDKAAQHFLEAEEVYLKEEMQEHLGGVYANLGSIHQLDSNYLKSEEYFIKSKDAYETIDNQKGKAVSYMNLGDTYILMKDYQKAIPHLEAGLKIANEIGIDYLISNGEMGLSTAYIRTDRAALAIPLLLKAEKRVINTNTTKELNTLYDLLAEAYNEIGEYQKAYQYHVKFSQLERKLALKNSTDKLAEMEAKFETHEKEKQLLIQQNKLTKQEAEIKTSNLLRNLFITIGIALLVILLFIYRNYRDKKAANTLLTLQKNEIQEINEELNQTNEELEAQRDEIESQKDALQAKNNHIISSINYAKRIQDALLKSEEHVSVHLPPHFILYKPKDIVSGDFYWALEKQNHLYIAAVDCTGHGVPGGFLTMLGTSFLNEINSVNELLSPSEILDQLRAKLIKDLSADGNTKDGMDISLLKLHLNTLEAEWAGANNPLYLLSAKNPYCEIEILKGDKEPIGYHHDLTPFTNHKIQLEKRDTLYLFTDGYADQFGGPKGRKLGYKKFREVLAQVASKSMDEQKEELSNYIKEWQKGEEQVDDICIIGIQV